MDVAEYLAEAMAVHDQGNATEHSYRAAVQKLFNSFDAETTSQNEPQRLTRVGAPDFSFHRGDLVIGHAEAKILAPEGV